MSILVSLLLIAGQQSPSTAATAADRFALDLPSPAPDATPTPTPTATPTPVPEATPAASATAFSLDTPIAALIADPRAKAVLDRDVPGLSTDENLPKFATLSLRRLAPLSGGQMTAALLATVAGDLAAIDAAPVAARPTTSRRALPAGR